MYDFLSRSSIDIAVFQKIVFFSFWRQTDTQTNRQTDKQMDIIDA